MSERQNFIDTYGSVAVRATAGSGVFPSVQLAQAILESGNGKGRAFLNANNVFNIKSFGQGKEFCFRTDEFINGQQVYGKECFRVYDSVLDSFRDHVRFLKENPRYTKNGVFSANTPEEQAIALQRAGFATAPNYAQTLIDLIHQWDLKKYDVKQSSTSPLAIAFIVALVALNIYYWKDIIKFFKKHLPI